MDIQNVDSLRPRFPNNVNLAEDRQVLRALESWHPGYINWWKDMGPEDSRRRWSICARRCRSIRKAGRNSTM